jgi:putative transposase
MKKRRYSTEQIVAALKQVELGLPVADLIRQLGISEMTYYRWKKQYAGLESDQVRELKQVVEENARLKKLVAELSLDKAVLQDVLSRNFPTGAHETGCRLCDRRPRLQPAPGLSFDAAASFHTTQGSQTGSTHGTASAHA